ncbi:MAG: response regulator [Candidatus Brocadiaceae bacterium]|nr:response regulator [Candidatus Brocadiaceae bacterium]
MKMVLIADSNKCHRMLYEIELSSEGYIVITAKNGKEAVNIIRLFYPDVIVMDTYMPDIDVYDLVVQIFKIRTEIPVIMNTVDETGKDRYEPWCDAYIVKSSNLQELREKIRQLITCEPPVLQP